MNAMWDNLFRGDKTKKTIISALKANILFKDLTPSQLRLIQNLINVRNYRAGEIVFNQGELGVGMYILVKGSVEIFVEETNSKLEIKKNLVTQLRTGDFFGELALVEENGRRTATIICHEDCTLLGFFKPDLFDVINRSPEAGVKILMRLSQVLGARLSETTGLIKSLKNRVQL